MKLSRQRTRNSRWDFLEDRLNFHRWVDAPRPCHSLNWSWYGEDLIIKVEPHPQWRQWHKLTRVEIDLAADGWRQLVARIIRESRVWIRAALAKDAESRKAAAERAAEAEKQRLLAKWV